jgi:hypothetical protein
MVWDPIAKTWRGNDSEGRLFEWRLKELAESDDLVIKETKNPPRKGHIFVPAPQLHPGT